MVKAIGWAQSQSDYVFDFAEVGLYQHMAQWQDMGTVASVLEKLSIEVGLYQRHWSNRDCLYSHQQLSSFKQKHGWLWFESDHQDYLSIDIKLLPLLPGEPPRARRGFRPSCPGDSQRSCKQFVNKLLTNCAPPPPPAGGGGKTPEENGTLPRGRI